MSSLPLLTSESLDPWWDLFLPALYGERASVHDALRSLGSRPEAAPVVVRTLSALGRSAAALELWHRIRHRPEVEVLQLAVTIGSDPDRAVDRLVDIGEPARVGDAWCDRAARALLDGEVEVARRAVDNGLGAFPDHAELARFQRFLEDGPDPVVAYRHALAGGVPGKRPWERDAEALAVRANRGWVSAVRLNRRILNAPHRPPPVGSALGYLAAAGVAPGYFATAQHFATATPADPRVGLELQADLLVSHVDEGREASAAAVHLYETASALGIATAHDAARLLVELASRDDRLLTVGQRAAELLETDGSGDRALWQAWKAALGRLHTPDVSVREARVLAMDPTVSAEAWLVALDTLRLCGHHGEARRLAEGALGRVERVATARYFLGRDGAAPPGRAARRPRDGGR